MAMHTLGGPYPPDGGSYEAAGSEDECIGCFSLFQFSQNTDAASLEAALAAAGAGGGRGRGGGSTDGSASEAGSDDVVLEVNSWWLEHLTVGAPSRLARPRCSRPGECIWAQPACPAVCWS